MLKSENQTYNLVAVGVQKLSSAAANFVLATNEQLLSSFERDLLGPDFESGCLAELVDFSHVKDDENNLDYQVFGHPFQLEGVVAED